MFDKRFAYASISSGTPGAGVRLLEGLGLMSSLAFDVLCELDDENRGAVTGDDVDSCCNHNGFSVILKWFAVKGAFASYKRFSLSFWSANGFSSS